MTRTAKQLVILLIVCSVFLCYLYKTLQISKDKHLRSNVIDLRIIVIVFDRYKSVDRLLESLNEALYFKDRVVLEVWIDRSSWDNTIDGKTYKVATTFVFKHGQYVVHNHTSHVGIYGQWINTWNPSSDTDEIAVILEDDLTVSPYFYKWLKLVHKKYWNISSINGFSLQGHSVKLGKNSVGLVEAPPGEVVFLYPMIGSWGMSPKRDNWLRFQRWFHETSKNKSFHPLVPDTKCAEWYKGFIRKNRTNTMWTMWHVFHSFLQKEETMYFNSPGHKGLTRNWNEKGLHFTGREKPTAILKEWNAAYEQLPDKPVHLDLDSNVVQKYDPYASMRKKKE